MRFFLALIVGVVIGAAVILYYRGHLENPQVRNTGQQVEASIRSAGTNLQEKLRSLNLNSDSIKREMDQTGRVIREKAQQAGHVISDATADARVTGAIKAKLVGDPDLSAWNISVNTTQGVVTLSGSVSSADLIGKAVLLAMETDGVRQVISTLQVKAPGA